MKSRHSLQFWLWISASFGLGAASILVLIVLTYLGAVTGAVTFNSENRLAKRTIIPQSELTQRRKEEIIELQERKRRMTEKLVDRMYARYLDNPNSTMDFLVISGGGENGAFGGDFLSVGQKLLISPDQCPYLMA